MAYSQTDQAHIPTTLCDPVLGIKTESAWTGNMPTFFVGIVDEIYPEDDWTAHKQEIASLFKITDSACIFEIKAGSISGRQIDGKRLADDTTRAIEIINKSNCRRMRIVSMGIASSVSIIQAKESLVRGWQIPIREKELQFISLGESKHFTNLNFCKSLCMKQLCKTIQFYNTMDYNPCGYYRSEMAFHKLANWVAIG